MLKSRELQELFETSIVKKNVQGLADVGCMGLGMVRCYILVVIGLAKCIEEIDIGVFVHTGLVEKIVGLDDFISNNEELTSVRNPLEVEHVKRDKVQFLEHVLHALIEVLKIVSVNPRVKELLKVLLLELSRARTTINRCYLVHSRPFLLKMTPFLFILTLLHLLLKVVIDAFYTRFDVISDVFMCPEQSLGCLAKL
jgi:hypothetical protein